MFQEGVILHIEDDDADAALAARAFRRTRFTPTLVRSRDGVDALDYLFGRGKYGGRDVQELPALVLLDLKIPKINGLGVLKAIREDRRTRHLLVVILTSSNEERDRTTAYEYFCNSYVVKPLAYDHFVSAASSLTSYWTHLNVPPPLQDF